MEQAFYMEEVLMFLMFFAFGFAGGWILCAGYYAIKVREALGLGEDIKVLGYLNTKIIKRRLDANK
jgi:hypothetical protein